MNKRLKKMLSITLSVGLIASYSFETFALGNENITNNLRTQKPQIINGKNSKRSLERADTQNLPETPILKDSLSTKSSRVGKEIIHTIDGISFENNFDANYNTKGLVNLMIDINAVRDENFDKTLRFEKAVIPYTDIETSYPEAVGVEVIFSGWRANHQFQLHKIFKMNKDGENVDTNEKVVFTRADAIEVMKKNMGEEAPANDEDILLPTEFDIYFTPVDANGKKMDFKGIKKLVQESPIEMHYTTDDTTSYRDYQTLDAYVDWYTTNFADRTVYRTTRKYPYYETSDIVITPSKTRNLEHGETIDLNVNVKNTSKNLKNLYLTGGIDSKDAAGNLLVSDAGKNVIEDFDIDVDGNGYIRPGEEFKYTVQYTIPNDYDGKTITLDPYIFGVYKEKNILNGDISFVLAPDSKEYDPGVTLYMKSNGNGGGGAVVDPPTDPVNPPVPGKTVILASGEKYTDVLTATVLGNEKDAPILLSKKDSIDNKTINEIDKLNPEEIIVSGGPDSVSDKALSQLSEYKVKRISGATRYETASKIGDEVRAITGNKTGAMLVDGTNFPDFITMSTLASQKRVPIILTEPSKLTGSTKNTINTWGVNDITIGGSYNSVSQAVEDNLGVSKISRLGGVNRYATAELIANEVRKNGSKTDMILVDGTKFPDGLTVNSLASNFKAPIMLTEPDTLNSITANNIGIWSIKNILIGGGYNSVSKSIEDNLNATKKERVAGEDRYETAVKISQRLSDGNIAIGDK